MERNIKNQKRDNDLGMIIIVTDCEIKDHICIKFMDKTKFKEYLSVINDDIYFINVSDKTWEEFKNKNSKRFQLKTQDINGVIGNPSYKEINELLEKSSFLFLIDKYYVKTCTYYPKDESGD